MRLSVKIRVILNLELPLFRASEWGMQGLFDQSRLNNGMESPGKVWYVPFEVVE